jgi:hypothetical protein
MSFVSEKEMYPPVCAWLEKFLRGRHRRADVRVFDASRRSLARLIHENGLHANLPPEWPSWEIFVDVVGFARTSWEIFVDVVGFARTSRKTYLAFIECKNTAITLSHLSQLLGYSRISQPHYALLVAPQGPSDALRSLLLTFGRKDVLAYRARAGKLAQSIAIARWDETGACLDLGSIITGENNPW